MKRTLIALLTLSALLVGGNALAAGNATLTVTANVLPSCWFNTLANTLDFGNVDPTATVPAAAVAPTTFDYVCTAGQAITWTLPATATMTGPGGNIVADLTYAGNAATGTGAAQTLTVDGSIPVAQFANKLAGAYTGTATLTINP